MKVATKTTEDSIGFFGELCPLSNFHRSPFLYNEVNYHSSEDESNLGAVEIPLWLIPNGVMVTFQGTRAIFEREQGPPWQDVLTQMLEEQNSMLGDN